MPPLGWIEPHNRTAAQEAAHNEALKKRVQFTLPFVAPPKGVKVILSQFLKRPEVIADMGMEFTGFRQYTGSCVGVSTGGAIAILSAIQRMLTEGATKAMIPAWYLDYGRCRYNEGDHGQGEGAVDSVMFETLIKEGVLSFDADPSLPKFDTSDGFALGTDSHSGSQLELAYSDGASSLVTKWASAMKQFPLGAATTITDTTMLATGIINGYTGLYGCSMYPGHGQIVGSGDNAYVKVQYDGSGGHSEVWIGYWDHPNDGPLFLNGNTWDGSTYPVDPAGGMRCSGWMPEAEVSKALNQLGAGGGEAALLSHLNYFPAQPAVISWALAG